MMVTYHIDKIRSHLMELEKRLGEILSVRDAVKEKFYSQSSQEEEFFKKSYENLNKGLQSQLQRLEAELAADKERIRGKYLQDAARTDGAYSRSCSKTEKKLQLDIDSCNEKLREAKEDAFGEGREKSFRLKAEFSKIDARIQSLRSDTDRQKEEIEKFASAHKVRLDTKKVCHKLDDESVGFEPLVGKVVTALAKNAKLLKSTRRGPRMPVMTRISPLITYLLLILAHAISLFIIHHFALHWTYMVYTLALFVITFSLAQSIYRTLQAKVSPAVSFLFENVNGIYELIEHLEKLAKDKLEHDQRRCLEQRISCIVAIDEQFNSLPGKKRKATAKILKNLSERYANVKDRIVRKKDSDLKSLEATFEERTKSLNEQHENELKRQREEYARKKGKLVKEKQKEIERLTSEWKRSLDGFYGLGKEAMQSCLKRHPAWSDSSWQDWKMAKKFPDAVYAGNVHIDLKRLGIGSREDDKFSISGESRVILPLALSFPRHGSLFLSAASGNRSRALQILFDTSLRLLSSFPPGKARLIILDPVGLGQNFSALMHLSDYDESLVGRRIWTEPTHIERRVAELTEHIEKVIQKYLRNRYASIGEYNREAGEMTEAYQFLVIADFPTGFSELALDRLASIITSGVRCGVYTLILRDKKEKIPAVIDMARLRDNGPVIVDSGDAFIVEDDCLKRGEFIGEDLPETKVVTLLLHAIGKQCLEAKRVEVPFTMVVPKAGQYWSSSADSGIQVPLGRTGADRLQYLNLGHGTAQHALIAGKTGSGKSTLFHVMITNLALWFSPREVEFYLIDYKKGVEFKTFAVNHLPHARVIAIESDREFGLSVLERVCREFERRAELFRKNGVQDLVSYRSTNRDEYLPRTLLIVDEFQEFFTEDDAIAQDAALLLDRIVRQGRAFGIHVILGSQTLGGAYTLAKSTLGQMAVRIALQCNEADSYLILSDDNAAARLLSRPGEAIYNDMSGLVEGNNPFQVVWLPDEVQEVYLRKIQKKAEQEEWEPPEHTVVFEGNVLADLGNNLLLKELLEQKFVPADVCERVWLGEPNAIKGPTEVRFLRRDGSNLLIIGQRSEAALAMICSAVFGLAASHVPDDISIVIFDGSTPDSGHGKYLVEMAQAVPHEVKIAKYRQVPQIIEELDAIVKSRQEGSKNGPRQTYLMIFGLQRFRTLRHGDEYDFSLDKNDKPSTGECFANILREGPEQGVHSIIWCDSLNNLNRSFNRKTLREFGMRILFQMSATDSSELIDMPLASKLGLYKAALVIEEGGTVETFRPYAIPDATIMEYVRRSLVAKFSPRAKSKQKA